MSVELKALEDLDWKSLDLPPSLPITDVEVEEYLDPSGENSLRVTIVLAEAVDPLKMSGADVIQLKSAIREAIAARGVGCFAYIFLTKESERQQEPDAD